MSENTSQNSSNKVFLIAVVAIVVIIGGIVAFASFSNSNNSSNNSSQSSVVASSNYQEYSASLLKQNGISNRVLFFKADWCPSCNALDKEIKADLTKIPANTLILDVDYDKNQDLRTKYGVTSQHTLVLVDENGNQIKKWSGSRDVDAILKEVGSSTAMSESESMSSDMSMKSSTSSSQAVTQASTNNYQEYSASLLKQSGITNRVLFFKADWCPSCNALDKAIKADLTKIPANTLILDVDYDTNQALRTKYGVTSQHTLVLVDENGNQIKKWSGSRDVDAILKQI